MKKQLLIAALLLGAAFSANAQDVIYAQNFEGDPDDILDEGWEATIFNGENSIYGLYNSSASIENAGFTGRTVGASTFEMSDNDVMTHIEDVDLLITSGEIELPEGESTLSYRIGSVGFTGSQGTHYSTYIITFSDMEGIQTLEALKEMLDAKTPLESATISGESSVTTVSVSQYAGQLAVIAFRLHDTDGNSILLVDDVKVTSGALGTDGLTAAEFVMYPNPATDVVNIAGNNLAINTVTVADLNGRIVKTLSANGTGNAKVDLSGLSAGIYVMTVESDAGTATKKIIKQ